MLTKFFEVLPKKVRRVFFISSSITSNCRMTSFEFRLLHDHGTLRAKSTTSLIGTSIKNINQCLGCLRMEDQGVQSHQTYLVKNFTFLLPPRKQDDRCAFKWVLITDHRFKAASCTFVKKNDNVQHYFEDKFDFWNISKATTDWLKRSMAKLKLSH